MELLSANLTQNDKPFHIQFMEKFIGTYSRQNLSKFQSLNELHDDVTEKIGENFSYAQSIHGISKLKATMMCSLYQTILFSSLAEGKNELTPEIMADVTTLLSSCKDAESAEIPTSLDEIASTLLSECDTLKAQEFCDMDADKGIQWLTENCTSANELFKSFIAKNAHRGFQEVATNSLLIIINISNLMFCSFKFDIGFETWEMKPSLVIEMVQKVIRNRNANDLNKKCAPKRSNEELMAELKASTKYVKAIYRNTIFFSVNLELFRF